MKSFRDIHLRRSRDDRYISGVCGGIAAELGIDATIIRLVWAALTILTGVAGGVVLYIIASIIMPSE